jgi:Zn-dependent peptidase ImmA (M78 family)
LRDAAAQAAIAAVTDFITLMQYPVPVDLEQVARDLGVVVQYATIPGGRPLGYSAQTDQGRLIVIHRDQPATRRRFTLAHELGHVFLHFDRHGTAWVALHMAAAPSRHWLEVEADAAAGAILLPDGTARAWMAAWRAVSGQPLPLTPAALDQWAATAGPAWARGAGMSLEAVGYRLADLGWLTRAARHAWWRRFHRRPAGGI